MTKTAACGSARKFDRLLVWKVSRLGRDTREVISTVYELADLGITVVPIKSQTGPISSTMGKLVWAIQAWYAEMENSEKSESIKAGQARARAGGKHVGRPRRVFNRHGWYGSVMWSVFPGRRSPAGQERASAPWCKPTGI
jgi:DNA invertase Pin-like site-specific DNA recombinase